MAQSQTTEMLMLFTIVHDTKHGSEFLGTYRNMIVANDKAKAKYLDLAPGTDDYSYADEGLSIRPDGQAYDAMGEFFSWNDDIGHICVVAHRVLD